MVIGAASFGFFDETADALVELIPDARRATLEGQEDNVDPAALAPALAECFRACAQPSPRRPIGGFATRIRQSGRTATGIQVPDAVVEALGAGRRSRSRSPSPATYRSTVAVMGGASMIRRSAEHRTGAGVAGGEEVEVDIDLDTAPAGGARAGRPGRRAGGRAGGSAHLRRPVLQRQVLAGAPGRGAKTETRQRRSARSVDILKQGRAR